MECDGLWATGSGRVHAVPDHHEPRESLMRTSPTEPIPPAGITWHKSSHSNAGGDCVQVGRGVPGVVPFRDSKVAGGPVVAVNAAAWSVFVGRVRAEALPDS